MNSNSNDHGSEKDKGNKPEHPNVPPGPPDNRPSGPKEPPRPPGHRPVA